MNFSDAVRADIEKWFQEVVYDFNSINTMGLTFQVFKDCDSTLVVDSCCLVNKVADLIKSNNLAGLVIG